MAHFFVYITSLDVLNYAVRRFHQPVGHPGLLR
jgi:hypothetical protein